MSNKTKSSGTKRRKRGFERASALAATRIRAASESRGFAVARLLTHWIEVVGPEIAEVARPVEISYGRGFGATLTVLTTGARAPMLEMEKDRIRDRVNACYGYAAVQKVRITQTAATGFAAGQAVIQTSPAKHPQMAPISKEARAAAADIHDTGLRQALEKLGANVLSPAKP
ncbi:MAG: DciA family protein [Pseudomonadota bacterium]